MNEHKATEIAFKNGYKQGVEEMRERLKADFRKYDRANWAVRAIIDESAKELLERYNED